MEVPPLLIKGKFDLTGNSSTATAILIIAWNIIGKPNPTTTNLPNKVVALWMLLRTETSIVSIEKNT
jgi:hypothetical protein